MGNIMRKYMIIVKMNFLDLIQIEKIKKIKPCFKEDGYTWQRNTTGLNDGANFTCFNG